jgi:hypothetical protein
MKVVEGPRVQARPASTPVEPAFAAERTGTGA